MGKGKKFTVKFKRKREKRTNYKKRLKYISSSKPRLVIRCHLNTILLQIVKFQPKGDKVILSVNSKGLDKFGWPYHKGNIPSAYLTGLLLAKKAKEKKINEVILDIGLQESVKHSRIYAVVRALTDSKIVISHSKEILPSEEKISGKHIINYWKTADKTKQFSSYVKKNLDVDKLSEVVNKIKEQIMK